MKDVRSLNICLERERRRERGKHPLGSTTVASFSVTKEMDSCLLEIHNKQMTDKVAKEGAIKSS